GLFNTSQQIGGALGLAVLSTLATSKTNGAGGAPLDALVVGFHWAFGVGAVVTLAALAVMVALLRRRHVARIEEQAASGDGALVPVCRRTAVGDEKPRRSGASRAALSGVS